MNHSHHHFERVGILWTNDGRWRRWEHGNETLVEQIATDSIADAGCTFSDQDGMHPICFLLFFLK
jgi:hypothetical protein